MATDECSPSSRAKSFVQAHLTLVITGALFLIFVLKVYSVARGNLQTAKAILSATGPSQAVLGIALTLGPPAFISAMSGLLLGVLIALRATLSRIFRLGTLPLAIVFLVAMRAPTSAMGVILGAAVLTIAFGDRLMRGGTATSEPLAPWTLLLKGWIAVLVLLIALDDEPWLPAQTIKTTSARATTGYVLREDSDILIYLRNSDRAVVRVPADSIEAVAYCQSVPKGRPLLDAILDTDKPKYPRCAK